MNISNQIPLINAISEVQKDFITHKSASEVFDKMLSILLDVTESEYGFIGEVLNDGSSDYLKTHAITNIAWNKETKEFYENNAPQGLEFRNLKTLFGKVITTKQPVVSNDPYTDPRRGGLPEGHPYMGCFLGLPLKYDDDMCGMVGIANRKNGYDDEIINYLEPFLAACAHLIMGFRIVKQNEATQLELQETVSNLSNQNSKLTEFTYIVSHDIRKHASNLKMLSNIVKNNNETKEIILKSKAHMWNSIDHLMDTVDYVAEIVEVSVKSDIYRQNVKLKEFVCQVVNSMKIDEVEITIDIPEDIMVNVERGYLNSIIENLTTNAIKYRSEHAPTLHITAHIETNQVAIAFRDNGIGIDMNENGSDLFKMFATFHGNKDSKGMGLFLVQKQVEALGGEITVQSVVNKGSNFVVTLPLDNEGSLDS